MYTKEIIPSLKNFAFGIRFQFDANVYRNVSSFVRNLFFFAVFVIMILENLTFGGHLFKMYIKSIIININLYLVLKYI